MNKEYEKLNTRLKEQMQTDLNFDIVVKPLLVQGVHMNLYFVDGFAKDEILEKMMEFLLKADLKNCVETQDVQTFCDSMAFLSGGRCTAGLCGNDYLCIERQCAVIVEGYTKRHCH